MRIWIDSDMGFDDLWAILTARSLGIQIVIGATFRELRFV